MYKSFFKPLFDKLLALILIIVFSPIMIITAILIYLKMGRPVIFTQERPGYKVKYLKFTNLGL